VSAVPADFAAVLRAQARDALAGHPDLRHEWRDDGRTVRLAFPRRSERGFDVAVEASADGIIVTAGTGRGGTHVYLDAPGDMEGQTAHALGLAHGAHLPKRRAAAPHGRYGVSVRRMTYAST
jgi:hypothetical protein